MSEQKSTCNYFDLFLSSYIESMIVKNLGKPTLNLIESILSKKNMKLHLVVSENILELENTFYLIFGKGKDGIMKKIFHDVFSKTDVDNSFIVTNRELENMLFEVIHDTDKMKIMIETMGKSKTKKELYSLLGSSLTEIKANEKISDLVYKQLLVPNSDGIEIKYSNILRSINFKSVENTLELQISLNKKHSSKQFLPYLS